MPLKRPPTIDDDFKASERAQGRLSVFLRDKGVRLAVFRRMNAMRFGRRSGRMMGTFRSAGLEPGEGGTRAGRAAAYSRRFDKLELCYWERRRVVESAH